MKVERATSPAFQWEDETEYSTVTGLRGRLLAVVDSFRKSPAKRYLITKHGQPQAVLMSFETYRLLKRAMSRALPPSSENGADEVKEAVARLRIDRDVAQPPESATQEKEIQEAVFMIRRHLDRLLETSRNKRPVAAEPDQNQTSR